MPTEAIQVQFVNGSQESKDSDAADDVGRIDSAFNLHIRPEHAGVLHKRPGLTTRALPVTQARTRVASIGDDVFIHGDQTVYAARGAGAFAEVDDYPITDIISAERYPTSPVVAGANAYEIMGTGYSERSDGSACECFSAIDSAGDIQYNARTKPAGGFWSPSFIFAAAGGSGAVPVGLIWVAPRTGGGWVFVVNAVGGEGRIYVTASDTDNTLTLANASATTQYHDLAVNGTIAMLAGVYAGGVARVRALDLATGVPGTVLTVSASVSPTYMVIALRNTGAAYVYHGGYPADPPRLYAHSVDAALTLSTARSSVAQPFGSTDEVRFATCSALDTTLLSAGGTAVGSFVYVVGGAAQERSVGRLFFTQTGASIATAGSQYAGAIEPQGKLWLHSTFVGARVFGVYNEIMGCWQLYNDFAAGKFPRSVQPAAYYSVTLGEHVSTAEESRSWSVYINGATAKALLSRADTSHTSLVHVGASPTTGTLVDYNGFALFLGGAPRYWDGSAMSLAGIPTAARCELTIQAAGGVFGATDPLGTYIYAVVAEWHDAKGRRQQSPVVLQTIIVATLNDAVLVNALGNSFPLDERYSAQKRPINFVIYRSAVGETTLRRGPSYGGIAFGTSGTIILTDDGSGLFPGSAETLYTTGGDSELPSTALEATHFARGFSDRLLTVSPNYPEQLLYTKTFEQGRAIEANQFLLYILPQPITGLALQDGNTYCFSANNIWAVALTFADDTGQGAGAIDPVPLSAGIGCVQPLSIVETPVGVFFVGPRGFYQIARGGGPPNFIGAEIETTFNDYPTIAGVAHNARTNEVAWGCLDGSNLHRVLVYNYQYGQWFEWKLGSASHFNVTCTAGLATTSAGLVAASVSEVFTLDDALYTDNNGITVGPCQSQLETRDFRLGNLREKTRVRSVTLACQPVNPVPTFIAVQESHDKGVTWGTVQTFETTAGITPPIYQLGTQKTDGVRFRIKRLDDGSPDPIVWSGMTLEVSRQGKARTAVTQRKG